MMLEWPDLVGLFTLLELILLCVVALRYTRGRRLSNRLLAGFMASNAILIGSFLLSRFQWVSQTRHVVLHGFGDASYLLLMPFLYLYIRSLCYKDFRLTPKHVFHTIPFFAAAALSIFAGTEYWIHQGMVHIQIASYLVASAKVLSVYRKRLKQLYSSLHHIDLSWCNLLLVAFAAMWLVDLSGMLLDVFHLIPGSVRFQMMVASLLINLGFTLAVAYKGLVQPDSVTGILTPQKYAASQLTAADCASIMERLAAFMRYEKPYLDPSLTVDALARKLKIPGRQLSQAIHTQANRNFFDLVNAYRVEAAKEMLHDPGGRAKTLLAVAYDAGFNSKSVFNAAFKKHAGVTPREYRRNSGEYRPPTSIPATPPGQLHST